MSKITTASYFKWYNFNKRSKFQNKVNNYLTQKESLVNLPVVFFLTVHTLVGLPGSSDTAISDT